MRAACLLLLVAGGDVTAIGPGEERAHSGALRACVEGALRAFVETASSPTAHIRRLTQLELG